MFKYVNDLLSVIFKNIFLKNDDFRKSMKFNSAVPWNSISNFIDHYFSCNTFKFHIKQYNVLTIFRMQWRIQHRAYPAYAPPPPLLVKILNFHALFLIK